MRKLSLGDLVTFTSHHLFYESKWNNQVGEICEVDWLDDLLPYRVKFTDGLSTWVSIEEVELIFST